jgi:peptidyl-prolyl cis-trans isomerase SurA
LLYVLKYVTVFFLSLQICGQALAAEMTVNKIAAVVNGEMITQHELRQHTMAELSRLGGVSLESEKGREVQKQVLEVMINDMLMRQEAKRYKLSVSDAEVEEELNRNLQRSGQTRKQFEDALKNQKVSLAMYKERINNFLLRHRMATYMVSRKVFVTPEDVSAYYGSHRDEFAGEKTVDFSILMLPDGKNFQDIYQKIKSGVLNFEDAARQYSADQYAQSGGHVSAVFDRLPPEMKKLLSGMKDGQLSPLLRTKGGAIVIKKERFNEARPLTFEEARPRIEEMLKAPLLEERFKEYVGQLRGKSVIDIRI